MSAARALPQPQRSGPRGPVVRRAASMCLAAAAITALLAGCASTSVDASWSDPQAPLPNLAGQRVLAVCEAYEPVVRQICQDRLDAELTARGATPVHAEELVASDPGRSLTDGQLARAAYDAKATAAFVSSIVVGSRDRSPGFSIGIGGFGIGGGGVGGGVGVSAPIGGGQERRGYAASGRLTAAADGRLLWTARASAEPSADVSEQLTSLNRALVESAAKAGAF